jgi:tRNA dimethylallyltransferase
MVLCGPTAIGKTDLSLQIAETYGMEIISADSRQVYRLMDIGTAKPSRAEQACVPHHMIDIVWPDENYHAARYIADAGQVIDEICGRGKQPLLVGGTGLYIRAMTEGLLEAPGADEELRRRLHARAEVEGSEGLHRQLSEVDPETAVRLHPNDLTRIVRALEVYEQSGRPLSEIQQDHQFGDRPYRVLKIGLEADRAQLYARINQRAEQMFAEGLIEEVESLLASGYSAELKTMKTIGYRQVISLLEGRCSKEKALEDVQQATRRYAKQQITWLRQDKSMIWVDSSADFVTIRAFIDNFYDC